ncbi:hypothetical protein [Leptolyngbya sp. 7M]|uniref:hypothetical protein n=1 Tax=Leptolyngbya sp. 7M TaxID=2812896 RepID=UPI001B8ADC70|nr:hypothetical protein [Leptolyngbya sp. 7M]QYO65297.1 hypothetical protein JVX88_00490 [Leptolyngbya sp. 7M]
MIVTIKGTDTKDRSLHEPIFDKLLTFAVEKGFEKPDVALPVIADGPLDGWTIEKYGPAYGNAEFVLAVTSPKVPGISPIFPVRKSIEGPLFAVVVLDSAFVIYREDAGDVIEVHDIDSVLQNFKLFLDNSRFFGQ